MKQKQFELQHERLWAQVECILRDKKMPPDADSFPALYRRLCQSLALCIQRGYSPALTDYLQKLVLDGHRSLYGTAIERPNTLYHWLFREMPYRVRQEWRLLVFAMLAFWGVGVGVALLVWFQPHWAYSFISPEQLSSAHSMYQPDKIATGRNGSQGDVHMFGFYIWNNVSICFRTFAGGIFGGLPALISLLFNGMHFGVIASWLTKDPLTREAFWSFVVTHSSFEIAGLLLSGVAGMRLGLSLIHPGRLTRRHALMVTSQRMFPVLVGAAVLTVLAAFFEGFWSASTAISPSVKYAVGAVCWAAVIAFFALAGRAPR
jgi:uncharacterized membrane protein SpoIIM required for sporulation